MSVAPFVKRVAASPTLVAGSRSNVLMRAALFGIWLVVVAKALWTLVFVYPFSVDLDIPLRAARRWVEGGDAYLASSFTAPPGATQPFLYPPFVLPPVSLLLNVPRIPLGAVWFVVCLGAVSFAFRRLAIPARWWPVVLAWPPFAEAVVGGNVQVFLFAAFAALFWRRPQVGHNFEPVRRDIVGSRRTALGEGALAAVVGLVKPSQFQPWLYVLRRRPAAAIVGAALVALIVVSSLLFTGLALWGDWLEQLARAATATGWDNRGFALGRFAPPGIGIAVTLGVAAWILVRPPRRHEGEWIGIGTVLGATNLQVFGLQFLLPSMLMLRREIALVAAIFITTYSYEGLWAGILVVTIATAASARLTWLLEPAPKGAHPTKGVGPAPPEDHKPRQTHSSLSELDHRAGANGTPERAGSASAIHFPSDTAHPLA